MNFILLILLIIAGVLAVMVLILSYIFYRMAFYNDPRIPDDPYRIPTGPKYDSLRDEIQQLISGTLKIPYEPVTITSRDGLKLFGKYYNTKEGAPVCLLMHGWHGIAERDFAAGVQIHLRHGNNVLLVDERAMGKSEGHTMTFGIRERYDCLDWIRYIIGRCGSGVNIIIHGVSMGAAAVMMAAGLDLPENVRGIMADSGFTSPKEIICKVITGRGMPPKLIWPFVKLGARLFGHFNPEEASARKAMSQNKRPVMLIHGTGDDFVPCRMSDEIYALTKGPKYLVKTPGAPHVMAYMYDKKSYLDTYERFFRETLSS